MGTTFNFSGPVTMHVYADGARPLDSKPAAVVSPALPPALAPAPAAEFVEKSLVFDPDYAQRAGYDTRFLGTEIPAPTVAADRIEELFLVSDYRAYFDETRNVPEIDTTALTPGAPFILDYHHYSLAFNKNYFMCMWTASNCDYRESARQDSRSRSELGGENWRADPRVPETLQLLARDIYKPAKRIEQGHIVRREDNCWGAPGPDTEYANSDTYHFTNCTPQHEAFNKETPTNSQNNPGYKNLGIKGVWGSFEAGVEKQLLAGGGQAVIFAGPVLADFFDVRDWATGLVSTPKRFWKVVVVPASKARKPKLLAYGYVFDQTDVAKRFGLTYDEALVLPMFDNARRRLSDISLMTGVVFDDIVIRAEQAMPGA